MEHRTLVLTNWFFPYQILRWQDAVRLLYVGSARLVAGYDEKICSPSVTWDTPAVIALNRSVRTHKKGVKFSRFNVFNRDRFTCQYCARRFVMRELTYDHMIPRDKGGKTTWTNIVTACKPCNSVKGRKTCDEAGMFPRNLPTHPRTLPIASPVTDVTRAPAEWLPFLPVTT